MNIMFILFFFNAFKGFKICFFDLSGSNSLIEKYEPSEANTFINKNSYKLLRESVGVTATSRLLSISKTTVIKRIKQMACFITKPLFSERHQYYELDEMALLLGIN